MTKKFIFIFLLIGLLFININVFAYNYADDVANQIQGNNIQQRVSIYDEENNEYLTNSINELSKLETSVSYADLADLQNDKHYPVEVLITGIISFIFIITMSLCIVLNGRKRKALN